MLRIKLAAVLFAALLTGAPAASSQMRPVNGAVAPDSILPASPLPAPLPPAADVEVQDGSAPPPPLPKPGKKRSTSKRAKDLPDIAPNKRYRPFTRLAIAVKADSLGLGGELATPLGHSFNLRAGVSLANVGYAFDIDGVNYNTGSHLKSGTATIDWFPRAGGFHISPGVLYLETSVGGSANVPAGHYFSLGDTSFANSIDDPVSGIASFRYDRKVFPMLLVGFGNLLPRSGRHLSIPFELGAAYTGQAAINVSLSGTTCTTEGCFDAATDPRTQTALRQELSDINKDLKPYPFYPIISLGVGYRF